MLPLPRHLLKNDPEDALREIEDDPLSQFLWSLPTMIARKMHAACAIPISRLLKPENDITPVTECCTQ